jgi:hypothetical protein
MADEIGGKVEERGPQDGIEWLSTRVDTTVAMAFAASCMPLMKIKEQRDRDQEDEQ